MSPCPIQIPSSLDHVVVQEIECSGEAKKKYLELLRDLFIVVN